MKRERERDRKSSCVHVFLMLLECRRPDSIEKLGKKKILVQKQEVLFHMLHKEKKCFRQMKERL